jgi:hypothetical protein
LYSAIHITGTTKTPVYTSSSEEVAIAYDPEEMDDYTAMFSYIISKNIPVLIYAGEFD